MDTSRTSKRSEPSELRVGAVAFGVTACVVLACAGACGASYVPVTALSLPDASRQPDGVVIEPTPALPEVEERAPASGVVALRAPLGSDAVVTVVRRLFRAFAHEDVEGLQAILTDDAAALGVSRPSGTAGKGTLLDQWRMRVKNPAYARLAGVELVEGDRIARFTYEELGVPGAPERPLAMKPGELLVKFPVAMPRVGSEQLFGDAMTLVLRREGRTYKISGVGEENGP